MKENDDFLVSEFKDGNQKALSVLVNRYHKLLCERAYWILKDSELAKDVAQETWRIVIIKIQELKDHKRFSSWVLRIVYNKSFDALRQLKKDQKFQKVVEYTQETSLEKKDNEDLIRLKKLISFLPHEQKVVLQLFYVQEYSLSEISEIIGVSVGTIKSRLFYAREKLKMNLKSK